MLAVEHETGGQVVGLDAFPGSFSPADTGIPQNEKLSPADLAKLPISFDPGRYKEFGSPVLRELVETAGPAAAIGPRHDSNVDW